MITEKQKDRVFTFPESLKIQIPEKYNEEWLKTASIEEQAEFLDKTLNYLQQYTEQPKFYKKADDK